MINRQADAQWIDITDYAPGDYTMQVIVDVENKVQESNEDNNVIYVNFTVPEACPVIHHFTANVQPDFQVWGWHMVSVHTHALVFGEEQRETCVL